MKNEFKKKIEEINIKLNELDELNNNATYSVEELTRFGEYLLSNERKNNILGLNKDEDYIDIQNRLKNVYHADFCNWLASPIASKGLSFFLSLF